MEVQEMDEKKEERRKKECLASAVFRIAWAYVFLYLDIWAGTWNLLPDFVGFLLIVKALGELGKETPSLLLLKPLGYFLAGWGFLVWVLALFGGNPEGLALMFFARVVSLYFHFQLWTNLAEIADRNHCSQGDRLRSLRTVITVMLTVFTIPFEWEKMKMWAGAGAVVMAFVAVWIVIVLFGMRKELGEVN